MSQSQPEVIAYSITSAGRVVDYTPRAIRKAIDDGDLPAYGHGRNGQPRILRDDLIAWIQNRPIPSLSDTHAAERRVGTEWEHVE